MQQGLATSTQAGQRRYLTFCSAINRPAMPTSEEIMLMFVSHLAQEGLAHTSIKVYLSAVRNLHISAGYHEVFARQLTPRLELVLKGIKRDKAGLSSKLVRLPITIDIMGKIKQNLSLQPKDHTNILLWAACCVAFFGFLRCGEFTVPSQADYDPGAHLSLDDIAIDDKKSPSVVQVNIKQSKTDPFRQGVQVYLGKTGKALCPVEALLPYLAIRGANPGPLFILKDGSYLTRQRFASLISTCLRQQAYQMYTSKCWAGGGVTRIRHTSALPALS